MNNVNTVSDRDEIFAGIVLTARTESLLAHITPEDPLVSGDSQSVTLSRAIPTLLDFADLEKGLYEDAFSAKVAAASAHMTLGDMDAANNTLPPNIETVAHQFLNEWGIVAKWTHISIVKAAYIRGKLNIHKVTYPTC